MQRAPTLSAHTLPLLQKLCQGHAPCGEPQNTLVYTQSTSASAILSKCPLCKQAQDPWTCTYFSFSYSGKLPTLWKAPAPWLATLQLQLSCQGIFFTEPQDHTGSQTLLLWPSDQGRPTVNTGNDHT